LHLKEEDGDAMYSFDRFTEQAKRTLTLAQEEAEATHHSYIGTEHLLVAMTTNTSGLAHQVLTNLGVEIGMVRESLSRVLGRNERIVTQEIIPTSRVKKIIEIGFEEARRMGDNHVSTGHLLLALLIEGEGIAAHILEELGVSLDKVRAELERVLAGGAREAIGQTGPPHGRPRPTPHLVHGIDPPELGPDATDLLRLAWVLASREGGSAVGVEHVMRALDDEAVRSLLQLAARIRQATAAREEAIAAGDRDATRSRGQEVQRLRGEYDEAESSWRRQLG
jgi:ATP-dependent Clp protease ATP-binding subunit ClpA